MRCSATGPRPIAPNPLHPGAIHLYIHTVEASDRPERAAPHAARLEALMPGAGHIVHMPAHIWYRLGMWKESLESNRRAVAADEAQLARGGASALYAGGYFAHNVHFVLASAMMGGDGPTAVAAATRLATLIPDEAKRAFPGLTQPVAAAPFLAHARFSAPEAVLALQAPAEEFPFIRAHWHYARGEALARLGRVAEARAEAAAIAKLEGAPAIAALPAEGVPGGRGARHRAAHRGSARGAGGRRPRHAPPASTPKRPRRRTGCPTWSRPSGTTPSTSRSARRCSRKASPPRPRPPSARR